MISVEQYNLAVDKYSDNLYRFALKLTKSSDEAKDLVQDAFEKLWKNRKKVDHNKIKSYLFTVVHNKFIDETRRNSKLSSIDNIDFEPGYWYNFTGIKDFLEKAIDKLPEIQKSVLLLRDWEGYSYKEIEQITGLSESQVKVYIFRARQFLRKLIGKIETLI